MDEKFLEDLSILYMCLNHGDDEHLYEIMEKRGYTFDWEKKRFVIASVDAERTE